MDKIAKLLKRISKQDREVLLDVMRKITDYDKSLKILKITNTDFFRVRFKNYRIIFHQEGRTRVIDGIRLRNNNTYKNL